MFRAADVVFHHPSGERWVLACDQNGVDVQPAGWPQTLAKASDCELKEAATDEQRLEMLKRVSGLMNGGYRTSVAKAQLEKLQAAQPSASPKDALESVIAEMRTIGMVAGQCAAESPDDEKSLMAAAEAERCLRWADALAVRASSSAETPAGQTEWQDIVTAPQDGTMFIGGYQHKTYGWVWDRCRFYDEDKHGVRSPYLVMEGGGKPTHWMPVVAPSPASSAERTEP